MNGLIIRENGLDVLSPETALKLYELETLIKSLKEQEDEIKAAILEEMEWRNIYKVENEAISVTYIAPTTRETFDSKALRKENPDLYDEYCKISPVKASVRVKLK